MTTPTASNQHMHDLSKPTMRKIHNEALPILLDLIARRISVTDPRVTAWYMRYLEAPREVVELRAVDDGQRR